MRYATSLTARRRTPAGFSLLECLLLVMIVGIVATSAGRMLMSLNKTPRDTDVQFQLDAALVTKMEIIRGLTYDALPLGSPSAISDTVTVRGRTYTRTVNIVNIDINGDGALEPTIKQVTVSIGGLSLATLVNQP